MRPNFAGVIDKVEETSRGWLLTMTDGRTIDEAQQSADTKLLAFAPSPGCLTVASTSEPEFVASIRPIESQPGCWDPWPGQGDQPIAWDEGDLVRFGYGLELPKAADYHADAPTHDVDGRQAWTAEGQSVQPFTVCANSSGQIEWLKLTSQLSS